MISEKIQLDEEGTAFLYTYCLDSAYGYEAYRKWPAVVVVPGGGYLISATKEGEAVAAQFLAKGFSCFVLRYSTYLKDREGLAEGKPHVNPKAHYPTQLLQLMQALHIIHEHADEWAIDEDAIFTCGFSAGAHISGSVALRWNDPKLTGQLAFEPKGEELRPAGSILCYPMISADLRGFFERMKNVPGNIAWQADIISDALFSTTSPTREQLDEVEFMNYVGPHVPPLFIWHSIDDPVVDPHMTTQFVLALQEVGAFVEYHLYSKGGHGLACANRLYARSEADVSDKVATWLPMAATWMDEVRMSGAERL